MTIQLAFAGVFAFAFILHFFLTSDRWEVTASEAPLPVGERRVDPASLDPSPSVGPSVGYRGASPRRWDADRPSLSFDLARPRGPDARLLSPLSLAIRVEVGFDTKVIVRLDAAREGDEVVIRAFAIPPTHDLPGWRARLARGLAPLLDDALEELTGVRPPPATPDTPPIG